MSAKQAHARARLIQILLVFRRSVSCLLSSRAMNIGTAGGRHNACACEPWKLPMAARLNFTSSKLPAPLKYQVIVSCIALLMNQCPHARFFFRNLKTMPHICTNRALERARQALPVATPCHASYCDGYFKSVSRQHFVTQTASSVVRVRKHVRNTPFTLHHSFSQHCSAAWLT